MRIGILGPLPPLRGGISHYNASLVDTLRKLGHDITTVSYSQLYPKFLFPGTSELDTSTITFQNNNPILKFWSPLTWRHAVNIFANMKVDLLVINHWQPVFAPSSHYILKNSKAKHTKVIAHNVLPHEKRMVGIALNRRLYGSAGSILVGATSELEKLDKLFGLRSGVVSPHPAYDRFTNFHNELTQTQAKERLGLDNSKPYLLYMGLVRSYKGVKTLLEASHHLYSYSFHLEIAGEFYENPEEYYTLIRKLNLGNRVKITNRYLTDAEAALRLLAADVMILPYRHATQSGMAMSALACGVPVIASSVGALVDVIEEGVNGFLVPPDSPVELADTIVSFINSPWQDWSKRRNSIQQNTLLEYSWTSFAERLTAI